MLADIRKKRCRHPASVLRSAIICGATPDIGIGMLTSLCLRCGELLPLGPAKDTPDALMELRAAELAADYLDCRFTEIWRTASADEHDGWSMHYGMWGGFDAPGKWSGWLAREIATHGEEQG
jgi:hypothetical protein